MSSLAGRADRIRKVSRGILLYLLAFGMTAAPFDIDHTPLDLRQQVVLSVLMYALLSSIFVRTFPFFEGNLPRRVLCSLACCYLAWLGIVFLTLVTYQLFG